MNRSKKAPSSITSLYEDPRNANLYVHVSQPAHMATPGRRRRLYPRNVPSISPWDSAVQGGDAVWEGLRVYPPSAAEDTADGGSARVFLLDKHLDRLFASAKAMGFRKGEMHTREEVMEAIMEILQVNKMEGGNVHIHMTLTRGEKCTSSINPKSNIYGTTLVLLPEFHNPTDIAPRDDNGIVLLTAAHRRPPPQCLDSKMHHANRIVDVLPRLQAHVAGAAEALMLDLEGYVAGTDAANLFLINAAGALVTPTADHCVPGIARQAVLDACREIGLTAEVRRVSLAEVYCAEEVFATGTLEGIRVVKNVDGREIGEGAEGGGPVTRRLKALYDTLPYREGWFIPLSF
uniref:Branched-chain-amino-acid transaminase n=1 Tax=Corethron hystrix TaxID=216773 RepID=A0A7S1G228_9STRA|mmetsp:Transcript_8021/g.17432  ORF Transcript_8021/g.17432 Transcript_8021/m.17432 type:complete len:347 (+) Transcript_8021:173-1213(+)